MMSSGYYGRFLQGRYQVLNEISDTIGNEFELELESLKDGEKVHMSCQYRWEDEVKATRRVFCQAFVDDAFYIVRLELSCTQKIASVLLASPPEKNDLAMDYYCSER